MRRIFIILFVALFLVGCNSESVPKDVVAGASSSDYGPPEVVGEIESKELKESSGLAVSQCQANVMWTHNDNGDAVIFALSLEGKHLGAWSIPNARSTDWEDIAIRKDASGKCFLYIGDIGNNDGDRTELTIFRIPEPVVKPEEDAAVNGKTALESEPAQSLRFSYPDAAPNAESLIVPPSTDDIYIVSKQNKGPATVYKLRAAFGADLQKAEKISQLSIKEKSAGRFTGGAVSPDGRRVMLCDNENGYEFVVPEGGDLSSIWKQQPRVIDLGKRKQGEGISYSADGRSVYASSEGKEATIFRVTRRY